MIANQRTGFGSWFVWLFSDRRLLLKIDKLGACPLLQLSMLSAFLAFSFKSRTLPVGIVGSIRKEWKKCEKSCFVWARGQSHVGGHLRATIYLLPRCQKQVLPKNHLFQRYPKQVSPGSWQYIEGRTAKLVVCPQQTVRLCCRPSSWGGSRRSWRWDLFSANSDADRRTGCTFCTHSILYPVFWRTPFQEKGWIIHMLKEAQNYKISKCEVYKKKGRS